MDPTFRAPLTYHNILAAMKTSRCRFITCGPSLTAGSAILPHLLFAADRPPAYGLVTLGVIGAGNQGINELKGFLQDPETETYPNAPSASDFLRMPYHEP